MILKLKSLSISAFRDFDLDQFIEFPQSSVTSIIGRNDDDGGSNGTGKTTLSIAPMVNLLGPTYCGISIKNLKNRHLSAPTRIIGEYEVNGQSLIVDRTLGGRLIAKINGSEIDGKSEDVQRKINETLHITPDQLFFLANKSQGEYGGFLLMKDSEKKEFLSSFFDVQFIEEIHKKTNEELKTKERDLLSCQSKKSVYVSNLETLDAKVVTLKQELAKLDQDDTPYALNQSILSFEVYLAQLEAIMGDEPSMEGWIATNADVIAAKDQYAKVYASFETEYSAIGEKVNELYRQNFELESKKKTVSVPEDLLFEKGVLSSKINELNKKLQSVEVAKSQYRTVKIEYDKLPELISSTESSSCPHCGSPLSSMKIEEKINHYNSLGYSLEGQMCNLETVIASEASTSDELSNTNASLEEVRSKILEYQSMNNANSIDKEIKLNSANIESMDRKVENFKLLAMIEGENVKKAMATARSSMASEHSVVKGEIDRLNSMLKAFENAKKAVNDKIDDVNSEIQGVQKSVLDLEEQSTFMEGEINILMKIDEITSKTGFVGYIFDSLLEELNSEINLNLKMIPNAKKFSLQFTPDKIAKTTKELTKTITYVLYSDNNEVDFETLSGGEKLSVIISVDEALDTVLSRRLGVKIGWKFLDEQFSWIDENSKESILEFYKAKSQDKAYFIIDHASEFNAALENRILIVKKNNIARINEATYQQ